LNVLIPETCLLLTPKGFCFPNEIKYGTEILTINSEKKLVPFTITEEPERPESYLTKTILSESLTCTLIPSCKIHTAGGLIDADSVKVGDAMPSFDRWDSLAQDYEMITDDWFKKKFDARTSPLSATEAKYLAQCKLKENRQQVVFELPNEEHARQKAREIKKELQGEIGGIINYTSSTIEKYSYGNRGKGDTHKIFFDNNGFYKQRERFDLRSDKINSEIYSNGFFVFFNFLHALLNGGYENHLQFFLRGGQDLVLVLPFNGKIRKLIQNTALIWNKYTLSFHSNEKHRNIDELKLHGADIYQTPQKILEIRKSDMDCYKIDLPTGSEIVIDYMHLRPSELTDAEMEHLESLESDSDGIDFAHIRRELTANFARQTHDINGKKMFTSLPFKTVLEIQRQGRGNFHVVGKFDKKGYVRDSKSRHGYSHSVTGLFSDDTGQIMIRLWGDFLDRLENGDILEIGLAYVQNGILRNKNSGNDVIHPIDSFDFPPKAKKPPKSRQSQEQGKVRRR
tara:strand:- start:351 stop:1883 length:1533 start_codon:yes stop_codon:yes gene_type:complete